MMRARLASNPALHTLLETQPAIFVYGEALEYKHTNTPKIPGYNLILHTAKKETNRRGIAVYFKEELRSVISKDSSSASYDILWIRWKTTKQERIICFFYAPGDHHKERIRQEFYDELRRGVDKHPKAVKMYMMGDSNARLGRLTGDRDIHGKIKTNMNRASFLGFLRYSGMYLLNNIYTRGQPTYEIL